MSAIVLCVVLSTTAAAPEEVKPADDLSGTWSGKYSYPKDDPRPPVEFSMTLTQKGAELSGRITEPNTFGDPNVEQLKATLVGRFDAATNKVSFTKTYDGTGGVSHDVKYEGKLSMRARRIAGTWDIDGFSGEFTIEKSKQTKQQK